MNPLRIGFVGAGIMVRWQIFPDCPVVTFS